MSRYPILNLYNRPKTPMSSRMRSRCQDNAKPMSKRIWEFCRFKVGWVSGVAGVIAKPMSRTYAANATIMRSQCQDECEADVKISSLEFVQSVQDNAKPMSCRMQSRCQDNAKPMSKRIWEFCRVKVGWVSRVVGVNTKPMSRICAADVKIMRSRCRDECEVDINTTAKPMSRRKS